MRSLLETLEKRRLMSATVVHESDEMEINTPTETSRRETTVHSVHTDSGGTFNSERIATEFDGVFQEEGVTFDVQSESREFLFSNLTAGGAYVQHNDYQFDATVNGVNASDRSLYTLVITPNGQVIEQQHDLKSTL